jgi:hypothetical protein
MNLATTGAVLAICASAVLVLTGLAAVTRALWKIAQDIRDNKKATEDNTEALAVLSTKMDGRITSLEAWRLRMEGRRPWGRRSPGQ